ncbi:carbohydrate-binding protein [Micromonospora auratinigra]|uniref:Glycosyl hydrolases family 16 n=1 Tax=Micromonospora auratinigra TaxID=261654 RepID=A0A1A8ZSL8_9ACTN|nr:carbohydrate-binding protein [Micromonospora auratinigra]SBT46863.1 Glycosyl hydrolases family 16 [Micromonospora auratinigra]
MNPVPAAPTAPSTLRRPGRRAGLAALAVAATTALAAVSMTAHAAVPAPPSGWSVVWSDDFTGAAGTLPSSANWIIDTGTSYPGGPANWGTGEIQSYTASTANLAQDGGGNLRITPLKDAAGRWTSARIETVRADFKPPAGGVLAIEGRIQMPNVTGAQAAGYWPAFWSLGSPYRGNYQNWPGIGEIDVMENVNGLNQVWGTLHCGVAPGGPCNEFNGLGGTRACPASSCQSAFHTYRTEWDASVSPQQLRWYVDGQLFHTVSQSQVGEPYWTRMTGHGGYFLLLNVAIGGSFPNGVAGYTTPTASTVSGRPMLVDYVAVYARGGGGSTTPPPSGGVDAYGTVQAEAFNAQNGVQVEACAEGGQDIGWLANGDWARYDNVDFGSTPPKDFVARVASGAASGVSGLVEVRLDSPTATPIGSFAIGDTGGWQSWRSVPGNVATVTGRHSVYLTFSSGQPADFVNVNWFTFRH